MIYILKEHLDELFVEEKDDTTKLMKRVQYLKDNRIGLIREKSSDLPVSEYFEAVELFVLQELSTIKKSADNIGVLIALDVVLYLVVYLGAGTIIYYFLINLIKPSFISSIVLGFIVFLPIRHILYNLKQELKQYE